MKQGLLCQAEQLADRMIRSFYCERDIRVILSSLGNDATWIGPGANEYKTGKEEILRLFSRRPGRGPFLYRLRGGISRQGYGRRVLPCNGTVHGAQ